MTKKEEKQHVYYIKISHKEFIQKPKKKIINPKRKIFLCRLVNWSSFFFLNKNKPHAFIKKSCPVHKGTVSKF